MTKTKTALKNPFGHRTQWGNNILEAKDYDIAWLIEQYLNNRMSIAAVRRALRAINTSISDFRAEIQSPRWSTSSKARNLLKYLRGA